MTVRWPEWSLEAVLAGRPAVRVNQLGYLRDGLKRAAWVTPTREPAPFSVLDRDGETVFAAQSAPWPEDREPTSGLSVHVLDFSALRREGEGFAIALGGTSRSHRFAIGPDLHRGLVRDALRFFTLQRSGCEIRVPGYERPAGHAGIAPNRGDTRVPAWSGPDAERMYPGWTCPGLFDVSGGWYDAGDHGKYVVTGAIAVWHLLATVEMVRRGAPAMAWWAETEALLMDECRWELEWLLRMQVPPGHAHAGMAFHRVHGTEWPPLPMWPHADPTPRVLHRPSTAATEDLAAAAAHGARVFHATDPSFANALLTAAMRAHEAAGQNPPLRAPDDQAVFGGGPYSDDDLEDERYWAAAELWITTRKREYAEELQRSPCHASEVFDLRGFDWSTMAAPARLDLALHGTELPDRDGLRRDLAGAAGRLRDLAAGQPWSQPYAPVDGWDWGSNGYLLNNLVVLMAAYELTGDRRDHEAAVAGTDYLFGRNALGQCYITGYGTDDSRHMRTRHFAHDLDPRFPPPPAGALAGGANSKRHPGFPSDPRLDGLPPQCCYLDEPTSETTNDLCIAWNAPLVRVATHLSLAAAS